MTESRFIQIHFLTAYPASLLNRDDAGLAKRIPFGGASRIRISSQCLKRHWRMADGEHSLRSIGVDLSVRSRIIFEKLIAEPLINEGLKKDVVRGVLKALQSKLLGESAKAQKAEKESGARFDLETPQVIILGQPEIKFITDVARKICQNASTDDAPKKVEAYLSNKEHQENLEALKKAASAGLDAALFGRMVTSDILARGDAAIHVAHALTVHAEEAESDYFTAVDDLIREGSAHLGETELTSGLFYGYVVVDVPLLVSNLADDRALVARVVENLIHLIAKVSPGAKLGSTAPYSYAHLILAEVGSRQPRTLANAFLVPVKTDDEGGVLKAAVDALGAHLKALDEMYGRHEKRRIAATLDVTGFPAEKIEKPKEHEIGLLDELAKWAAEQVQGAK